MVKLILFYLAGFLVNLYLCDVFAIENPYLSWYHFFKLFN